MSTAVPIHDCAQDATDDLAKHAVCDPFTLLVGHVDLFFVDVLTLGR
jgi:hypothetical protein